MDTMLSDIRYSARRLRAAPAFSIVATLTLGLAIAATTAVYSVIDALMLRPLPYRDPERLVDVAVTGSAGVARTDSPIDRFRRWRENMEVFEALEAYANRNFSLSGHGEPISVGGAAFTGGFMQMLGVPPIRGRVIGPDDTQPGRELVAVISEGLWRSRFGGEEAILGKSIRLGERYYQVIGVMPSSFSFPWGRRDVWVPLPSNVKTGTIHITARLRSEHDRRQAQLGLDTMSGALADAGVIPPGRRVVLQPPIARHLNPGIAQSLMVLAGAVVIVLLIACANLANLLLVQGATREREIAVRTALGASRRRVVRQLLTETLLLAVAGGAVGVLLAQWAIDLVAALTPSTMTFLETSAIRLDARVAAFAFGLTLTTAIVFGLVPALRGSRITPRDALQAGVGSATGAPRQERMRRGFVLLQLALSMMLLVGAGLLIRTFIHLTRIDPGFDSRNLVTAELSLPTWKYRTPAAREQFYTTLTERLRTVPGVVATTITGGTPPTGGGLSFGLKFDVRGRGIVHDDPMLIMPTSDVDPDYFSTMGIPLKAGRTFDTDDRNGSVPVVVIGESMARRLWPAENPVGQQVRWFEEGPYYTVVGVVGDVYQFEHDKPRGQFAAYYPSPIGGQGQTTIVVRTALDPATTARTIREVIWSVDPDQPIRAIETLDDAYGEFFATPRFYAFLMTVFAGLGLVIAGVGLYGVIAYATAQRTREFGIRLALGAQRGDVLRLVLRTGIAMAVSGIALGLAGSLFVTRSVESLLVDVQRTDVVTYVAVVLALGTIAVAACWVPAHRATRVDPVVALRYE